MNYDEVTQRELLAVIGSVPRNVVSTLQQHWSDTGRYAHQLADTIEQRLTTLTSPDGGWTGPGAEAFAEAIRAELVANLRSYALHAAGIHPQGEQHNGYDAQVGHVVDAVDASHSIAGHNGIPWDSDTVWQLPGKPTEPDPESTKTAPGTPAPAPDPATIRNGRGGVVKELDQDRWDHIKRTHPVQPVPAIYRATGVNVTPEVHHMDQLLEAVPLNTEVKRQCRQAVAKVVRALDTFAPPPAKGTVKTTSTNYAKGVNTPAGPTPTTPVPTTPTTPGPTSPGPGDPGPRDPGPTGPTDPPAPQHDPDPTGPGYPGGGYPGPGGGSPGGGYPGDGYPGGGYPGGQMPPAPGVPDSGTVGAGLPTGGVGGIGAPTMAGPNVGTVPVGAPGAGGLGGFGGGMTLPNSSFNTGGPGGRGLVNPGSAPSSLSGGAGGSGAGTGGAGGGTGSGSGGMAGAPMRRGSGGSDDDGDSEDFDGTWLEEDESVWGNRAGAPPGTIR